MELGESVAVVFQRGCERESARAPAEVNDGLGEERSVISRQTANFRGSSGDRVDARIERNELLSRSHCRAGQRIIADCSRDTDERNCVGDVKRKLGGNARAARPSEYTKVGMRAREIAGGDRREGEEPDGMALYSRSTRAQQVVRDLAAGEEASVIADVDRDSPQRDDHRRVEEADRHVVLDLSDDSFDRGRRICQPAKLEQLAAAPTFPEPKGPLLVVVLGGSHLLARTGQRLLVAVEGGERLGAPFARENLTRKLVRRRSHTKRILETRERRGEVPRYVFERALRQVEGERRAPASRLARAASRASPRRLARFWGAPLDEQVVDEAREVAAPKLGRQPRQCERTSSRFYPDVGREREHAGDAQPNFGLLVCRQHLAQDTIDERLALCGTARGMQRERGLGREPSAQRVVRGRELEGA